MTDGIDHIPRSAVDHATNTVLAYRFGERKDQIFQQLNVLLEPFDFVSTIQIIGAYKRYLDVDKHEAGKRNTQKIEYKNLKYRTWIKRLVRKTICFSKLELTHDMVIGLLINKVGFGFNIIY